MQRALLQWRRPDKRRLVIQALHEAGREDLIGFGKDCLVRPMTDRRKPARPAEPQPPQRKYGKVYGGEIVYTGPLDELFNLDLGALPYRTLDMKFETLDMDQFQPVGTVNYTTSEDYTRITEFKNMTGQVLPGKTTIMKEYSKAYTPGSGETPYYAILEPENRELYERYLERVQNLTNFHPVGRLAEYRYYDMDAVTNSSLDLSDEIIACHA